MQKQIIQPTERLLQMLHWQRPGGSKTERKWIERYLDSVAGMQRDGYGNRFIRIGSAPVLWSSHTDTVHRRGGRQGLIFNGGIVKLSANAKDSSCLGGDCTAGVWLMLEMLDHGIPGLYVFHRDEESGRKGSAWIAEKNPAMLTGIKHAIAFDRRGTKSVITFQRGTRCASEKFGKALAAKLGPAFDCDPTGSFTDTASYTNLVAECTNVSVGFANEHSSSETLDTIHLFTLRAAMLKMNLADLPIDRKPGDNESRWGAAWDTNRARQTDEEFYADLEHRYGSQYAKDKYGYWRLMGRRAVPSVERYTPHGARTTLWGPKESRPHKGNNSRVRLVRTDDDFKRMPIAEFIERYSAEVADVLEHHGYTSETLARTIGLESEKDQTAVDDYFKYGGIF